MLLEWCMIDYNTYPCLNRVHGQWVLNTKSKSYSCIRKSCKQCMQTTNEALLIYMKDVTIDAKEILNLKRSKGRVSQFEMQNTMLGSMTYVCFNTYRICPAKLIAATAAIWWELRLLSAGPFLSQQLVSKVLSKTMLEIMYSLQIHIEEFLQFLQNFLKERKLCFHPIWFSERCWTFGELEIAILIHGLNYRHVWF